MRALRRAWALSLLLAACAGTEGAPEPSFPGEPEAARPVEPESPESAAGPRFPPPPCPVPAALDSLFGAEYDAALGEIGLDRDTARCTRSDLSLVGVGRFRLPLYEALQSDPTLADRYVRTIRDGAFQSAGGLETSSMFAAARLSAGVRRTLLGDPLEKEVAEAEKPGALEDALKRLGAGEPPPVAGVPPRVAAAAALVLRAAARAEPWFARAFQGCADPGGIRARPPADATLVLAGEEEDDALRFLVEKEGAEVDLRYLARAAAEVLLAADRAEKWVGEAREAAPFEYRCATPVGRVILRGGGDDADDAARDTGPFLLRMDTGGNDRYVGGAASSRDCPVSILIDAGGDDVYEAAPDAPAFGAGCFGVAALVDMAGNDRYVLRGPRSLGLGAGVFGVGALLDRAGDDLYSGDGFCEGAGTLGWGTLCDLAGKDRYEAFGYSQGYGGVLGAGFLADLGGDDVYVLDDADIRHPAAQSKEHNSSLGQGFGFGVRADYLDGHSLAGGVGVLADREGDDRYSCGIFGQGGGYWMGVGMLLDGAGNDDYRGVWYVQGACAHFAVGILDDASGDDRYEATMNMAQGAGHDFSVGILLDHAGNDTHLAPNLSLGGGNDNGVGLFVDGGGDDSYRSHGTTLGLGKLNIGPEVPTLRQGALTLGVFLDLGGSDAYLQPDGSPQPFAGEGRTWTQVLREARPAHANSRGVGRDASPGKP